MKIIIINELYIMGGAEMQSIRETNLLRENGHDVYRISCDRGLLPGWQTEDGKHYNIKPESENWHIARVKRFTINKKLLRTIEGIFTKIDPDIIHINNITYYPYTFFFACRNYKTVQTIRDFGVVCPKGLCITEKNQICNGYKCNHCMKICGDYMTMKKRFYLLEDYCYLRHLNSYRNKYVNQLLCPSDYLRKTCKENGLTVRTVNNPFDFSILKDFGEKKFFEQKRYLVYGLVARHKGISQFVTAFKKFAQGKKVKLEIIGKIDPGYENEFYELIDDCEFVEYLGKFDYDNILNHLRNVYSVVVPSLWIENYPNTALEGLSTECIVLGSDRGGIPELIQDKRFIFDILDENSIIDTLNTSYTLDENEWKNIVVQNRSRVFKNNSIEKYYSRIINIFYEVRS